MYMKKVALLIVAALTLFAITGAIAFAHDAQVTLSAQNNSGQTGTAELTDMGNGTTKVVVVVSSNGTTNPQPIHIHNGTCDTLDPKPAYPLTSVVDGKSETIVNVSVADLLSKPYAINVHKSATEASVYTACGNIVAAVEPGMPTTGSGEQKAIFTGLAIVALSVTVLGLRLARRKA
jgi:hypothetical protein